MTTSTIATPSLDAVETSIQLSAVVAAIQALGTDGDVRTVSTIAPIFKTGVTVFGVLQASQITNEKGTLINLPSHKAVVRGAYALHMLGDLVTPEQALAYGKVMGDDLIILLDQPGVSAEVSHATIDATYTAKADASSAKRKASAEARKTLKAQLPAAIKTLLPALNAAQGETLDPQQIQFLKDLDAAIKPFIA